jgi:diguanylate cyclase (GGDEF)-like protein
MSTATVRSLAPPTVDLAWIRRATAELARGGPPGQVLRRLLAAGVDLVGGTSAVLLVEPELLPVLDGLVDIVTGRTALGGGLELVCSGPEADQLRDWADAESPVLSDDRTAILVPLPGGGLALHGADPRVLADPAQVHALQVIGDLVCAVATSARQLTEAQQRTVALEETRRRLREQNSLLRDLAVVDELTGLHNRRFFERRLAHEMDRFERYRHSLGLVLFDVDLFKRINDGHGHPAGDEVLRQLARISQAAVRRVDILARWGGEEFAILLPETGCEGASIVGERLRAAVEQAEFLIDGVRIPVTISLGVAACEGAWVGDSAALVRASDEALYRAKQQGRNCVVSAA